MRLFVALPLPEEVRRVAADLQAQLRHMGHLPIRWVDPGLMHLTLHFLGEHADTLVQPIAQAVQAAAEPSDAAARLTLAQPGAFPNLRVPNTLWIGIGGAVSRIQALHAHLHSVLLKLGIPSDERFASHLTIGRVRREAERAQRAAIGAALNEVRLTEPVSWPMGLPVLYQSTLTAHGPVYQALTPEE